MLPGIVHVAIVTTIVGNVNHVVVNVYIDLMVVGGWIAMNQA